jgi:hypothetical protein
MLALLSVAGINVHIMESQENWFVTVMAACLACVL